MRLHERTQMVTRAHSDATKALLDIWNRYDLTYGEIMAFHGRELSSHAKYMIREERHPGDSDKGGDEE